MKYLISFLVCVFIIHHMNAQSLSLFDVDAANFPVMKAKFFAFDAEGKQLRPSAGELTLTENGIPRTITSVTCPPDPLKSLSVCVMVDTYGHINLARTGTERLVNFLIPNNDEVGITIMKDGVQIHRDFTDDLIKAAASAKTIPGAPGVDIQNMFYYPYAGGVPFITNRKADKKILILVSDLHCPNLNLDTAQLYSDATKQNISVYSVLLGTNDYSGLFKRVAARTGGKVFEYVKTESEITNIFQEIERREHNTPCDITWTSKASCSEKVNIELQWTNRMSNVSYILPGSAIARVEVNPTVIKFGKTIPMTVKDSTIVITAHNADITVNKFNLKYSSTFFSIENATLPFTIPKGTSKSITVRFSPVDSGMAYKSFEILTDYCTSGFSTIGGFPGKKMKLSTLKITHPNGGETFIAGSDTVITWEGVGANDTVRIQCSRDNGKTWSVITNEASGLRYVWKNIPLPASTQCLIKIEQGTNGRSVDSIPKIEWEQTFSKNAEDKGKSLIQTVDGSYAIGGFTSLSDGGGHFDYDGWMVKVSPLGMLEMEKTFGGRFDEQAYSLQQTKEGGYIASGNTLVQDSSGYWIIKLTENGTKEWEQKYGGYQSDIAKSIQQTVDGGYIVAGIAAHNPGNKGNYDYWILKLSDKGVIEWEKSYGGNSYETAHSIQLTKDGGYIVVGEAGSADGDIANPKGSGDIWILKLNSNGDIEWQKSLGGSKYEGGNSIQETLDGGFIVAGSNGSNDGDVTGYKGEFDCWIIKLSSLGTIEWQKTLGGSKSEVAHSVCQTYDGGYIVAGSTNSPDGDVFCNINPIWNSYKDYWIVKLSDIGEVKWKRLSMLPTPDFQPSTVIQDLDGGYVVSGTKSNDFWIMKLYADAAILQEDQSDAVFSIIEPKPTLKVLSINLGKVLVGEEKDSTVTAVICNKGLARLHVLGIDISSGDTNDFIIPRGAGDFFLDSNECRDVMFEFMPSKVGNRTAKATIRTTIGDFKDTITITGQGIAPSLAVVNEFIDFGKTLVGIPKDSIQVVTIKNVGTSNLTITNTDYEATTPTDFSTLVGNSTFTLKPGNVAKMDLRFNPSDVGRTSGLLHFHFNGIGSPATVQLFGEGVVPEKTRTNVSIPDIKTQAGDRVFLTLQLEKPSGMQIAGAPTEWYARIHYNKTILFNEQTNNSCISGTDDSCVIELKGTYDPKSSELVSIPCIATLGNTDNSPLVIDEFRWTNGSIVPETETRNGTITINGICEQGGVRLFIPAKSSTSLTTRPNPAQNSIQIQYGLREPLTVTLVLLDITGQVVQTIVSNQSQAAGQYTLTNDMSLLGNGVYSLRLTTNKEVLTSRVDVVK